MLTSLHAKWKEFLIPVLLLSLSFFFIIYETTMFGVAWARTYSLVSLLPDVDIWVMDRNTNVLNPAHRLHDNHDLSKIKALEGVKGASFLCSTKAHFSTPLKKNLEPHLIGIDPKSPFGLPENFLKGKPQNLNYENGVFVDQATSKKYSLRIGSKLKSAEKLTTVVGIFAYPKTFGQKPLFITSLEHIKEGGQSFPFIIVKKQGDANAKQLKQVIEKTTHLKAYDKSEFIRLILDSTMKDAHLPNAFSAVVICGLLLALGICLSTLISLFDIVTPELVLYKTLGSSKIKLLGLVLIISYSVIALGLFLAFIYNLCLLAILPQGTYAFLPRFEILFLLFLGSILSATLIGFVKVSTLKTLGVKKA